MYSSTKHDLQQNKTNIANVVSVVDQPYAKTPNSNTLQQTKKNN